MSKKRPQSSATKSKSKLSKEQLTLGTPPDKLVGQLMFENGYYWYELSCCRQADLHTGIFVTTQEQEIRACGNNPVVIYPTEQVEVSDTIDDDPSGPIQEAPITLFCGSLEENGDPGEEPCGKHQYEVVQYIKFSHVSGPDSADLKNRTCKLIRLEGTRDIFVARILPLNTNARPINGRLEVISRSLNGNNSGRLLTANITQYTGGGTGNTWLRVFVLVD